MRSEDSLLMKSEKLWTWSHELIKEIIEVNGSNRRRPMALLVKA